MEVVAAADVAVDAAAAAAADVVAAPVEAAQATLQPPTPNTIEASRHFGPKSPQPVGLSEQPFGSPQLAATPTKL